MTCDVCGLPDLHNGDGDGIGSCDCPPCEGGCGAANWSALCTCPTEDEWANYPPQETYPGSGIYE